MSDSAKDNLLFKNIFHSSVEGILVIDDKGLIIKANPAGEQMFGYSSQELIHQDVESLIPSRFKNTHHSHRANYNSKPKARRMGHDLDLWGLKKDGSQFQLEISLSPTEIDNKKVVIAFIIDVTERMAAKHALIVSESRMAEAQQIAHVGNWYWNLQTNERSWSNEFYRIYGLEPGDVRLNKDTLSSFIHPDERENTLKIVALAIKNQTDYQYEKTIIRPDGSLRNVLTKGKIVSDANSNTKEMYGTIQDITKQKKAEEQLKDSEENLRNYTIELKEKVTERTTELNAIVQKLTKLNVNLNNQIHVTKEAERKALNSKQLLDNVSHNFPKGFIAVVDSKLRIVFVEGEEVIALGFDNLVKNKTVLGDVVGVSDEIKKISREKIVKTLEGEHLSYEIEFRDNHYLVNTTPLYNDNNTIEQVLLVYNNITLQKKAEFEMFNTLKKEQELSELKSRFISMASHEFRTPLSAILSSAILIEKQNGVGKEAKRINYVSKIRSNVKNLVVILNDFLSLSKLQEGKIIAQPVLFDLVAFTKSLLEELEDIKKKGQIIRLQSENSIIEAFLDLKLVKHIIYNLVSNAIKYSEENKEIIIKIKSNNEHVNIEIIDEGIGIPIEDQNNMFQRFYRANNASNIQGTGLGLNIVKQYTELMGGTITFKSELKEGATFYIEFPLDTKKNE
ncbi:PAS domain-containing sensor histidine kinase [Flavobacterium sp. PL002]|uniref:PAS domain-containing sensor histidine kinase n=1 Tax=Flavobacterium sp. PL002 TaxID=1897058 RepID=UPI001787D4FF|nr:PAS domain-containing sensor histidine kinase [Flavobacterium sp. PL002]MBE0391899.1 Signal transduction histidine-protein kinase BarA [Flavobacterium sp. PL002]